jgi:hypothetical protein
MSAGAIGAGVSAAGTIFGMIKQGQAQKRLNRMIQRQAEDNKQMFNSDYYKDFFDSEQARSVIKTLNDRLDKDNKKADNTAVVTGSTPEATIAVKEKNQNVFSDSVNKLGGYATQYKQNIKNGYMNRKMGYDTQINNMQSQVANSWGNFASNAMKGVSSSLNMLGGA